MRKVDDDKYARCWFYRLAGEKVARIPPARYPERVSAIRLLADLAEKNKNVPVQVWPIEDSEGGDPYTYSLGYDLFLLPPDAREKNQKPETEKETKEE